MVSVDTPPPTPTLPPVPGWLVLFSNFLTQNLSEFPVSHPMGPLVGLRRVPHFSNSTVELAKGICGRYWAWLRPRDLTT